MATYLYDGSFDGLASLLSVLIKSGTTPDGIDVEGSQEDLLFSDSLFINADIIGGEKLTAWLERESPLAMNYVCAAFMSETTGFEMAIYRFLRTVIKQGFKAINNYADDSVREMQNLHRDVFGERHRMLGLLRFAELSDGTFYAPFEPDHNIAAIVAPHFSRRLASQNWIIHDVGRNLGVAFRKDSGRWELFNMELASALEYSQNEKEYRAMWKRYYKEIAIPERKNPRCQKRFMPVRYWKYLTEKN
jgi:probable DNA metabolism protein